MSAPIPPAVPYCSLTDAHMRNYFTKDRIKQYLRRAGLLKRNGRIATEAEYENQLVDIQIGRQNRLKYDEALLEVLIELGESQYKLLCQEMEKIKIELQHQFRQIEKQYARRVHPIKIKVTHDGHIETETEIEQPSDKQRDNDIPDGLSTLPPHLPKIQERNRLDEIKKKLDEFIDKMNILAQMNANNSFLLNMPETIRQLKEKQEELRKQQESWKKDYEEKEIKRLREIKREFEVFRQQIENSIIDKRQFEQLIRTSSIIIDLRESISRIRELFDAIPVGLTQAAIDAAIATSEKGSMKRERTIEQLARDAGEQVKKLDSRLNELLTTIASPSQTISRTEIEKLIHQAMQNFKSTGQSDNNESHKLLREMENRLSQLEKRFEQLPQSAGIDNNRIKDKELNSQKTMKNQSTTQKTSSGQPDYGGQPYKNNETKVNDSIRSVPLVGNASKIQPMVSTSTLQNRTNQDPGSIQKLNENKKNIQGEKSNQTTVPQSIDARKETAKDQNNKLTNNEDQEFHYDYVPELQEKLNGYLITIENLKTQIDIINKTKPNRQTVDDLLKADEQQNEKKINDLQKCVNKNEDHLSKVNIDLAALRRHLAQQPTSISLPSTNKDSFARTYTEEEFQAIMPFIEPLSTLDIFLESEWDGIY